MFLSRIEVDMQNRELLRALSMPKILHSAIENCVLGERQRNLWRIDSLGEKYYLLIVSQEKNDFSSLKLKFGKNDGQPVEPSVSYENLFNKLQNDEFWRFRLCANPTKKKIVNPDNGKSKAFAVKPSEEKDWLIEKASQRGFEVEDKSFMVLTHGWKYFVKGKGDIKHRVSIYTVTYEGILKITDKELFKQTLISGMGRGKAYGCGMLTIAR